MTSLQDAAASREPLLWVQLLGLVAWPLEALGLLLLLAGGDPGPFPLLERLFCWGLGALLPAVFLWRQPPDPWSLVLVQVPLRGRREQQLRLSALPSSLGLRLGAAAGTLPLLALVWWADRHGGIVWSLSPLAATPRLVVLLICGPLLALMLWQWQQLVQAVWLLTRPTSLWDAPGPQGREQPQGQRLNLGLPLLLLPLLSSQAPGVKRPIEPVPTPEEGPAQTPPLGSISAPASSVPIETRPIPSARAVASPMAIDEQQPPEDGQGSDLNQQV